MNFKQVLNSNKLKPQINVFIIVFALFLSACIGQKSISTKRLSSKIVSPTVLGNGSSGGSGAVADTTSTNTSTTLSSTKVELSSLVDPFTGTFKKKVTIPKNFSGSLYIYGLNLSALASKIIKVRFNFGLDNQSQVFTSTLAHAPGITPATDVQVLVVDMSNRPFQNMRLPYDLYDYNDYNSDSSLAPVMDPLDGGLYCRGVQLSDDPTFVATNTKGTCSSETDKCLYTYAKIADSTYYSATGFTSTPTSIGVWTTSTAWTNSLIYGMCLPDIAGDNIAYFPNNITVGSANYSFQGPYRPINLTSSNNGVTTLTGWNNSLLNDAVFGCIASDGVTPCSAIPNGSTLTKVYRGLFQSGNINNKATWSQSLLFPRAGTLQLNSGINYLGSISRFGTRSTMTSDSTGTTKFVDGCNLRVQNYDAPSNEGIGSCNVTGSIEIFYMNGSSEVSITKSNELKLQLSKASITNSVGTQVLSSDFKACSSSTTCGSNECCYNSRCWSKDLVSQCVDDVAQTGNREIGTSCTSDYQCASLCCNSSTGACAAHNPTAAVPVYCSKQAGDRCVSQEYCAQESVPVCKLYTNGFNQDGTIKCTVRCPTVSAFGTCFNSKCVAPVGQTDTSAFDLVKCTGAIAP